VEKNKYQHDTIHPFDFKITNLKPLKSIATCCYTQRENARLILLDIRSVKPRYNIEKRTFAMDQFCGVMSSKHYLLPVDKKIHRFHSFAGNLPFA